MRRPSRVTTRQSTGTECTHAAFNLGHAILSARAGQCRYRRSALVTTQITNVVTCSVCLTQWFPVILVFVCLFVREPFELSNANVTAGFWPETSSLSEEEKVSRFYYKFKTINGNAGKKNLLIQLSMTPIFLGVPSPIFTPRLGIAGLTFPAAVKKLSNTLTTLRSDYSSAECD